MYNDNFLIEEVDLDFAKDVCKLIDDGAVRNRAVANVAAANFAKKYFEDFDVDIESGLHNIYQVLEDVDISDVYIKNNYIDVRLYFDEKELYLPKSHFDNNLLPVAYMFIKVDEELSNAIVTGFITPSSINTNESFNGFYKINENELVSFYDIEPLLGVEDEIDLSEDFNSQIFDYLDNKLIDKNEFYGTLLKSKEARYLVKKAAYAKTVFNFVSIPKEEVIGSAMQENSSIDDVENDENLEEIESVDLDISTNSDENELGILSSDGNIDALLLENEADEAIDLELDSHLDEAESYSDSESDNLLLSESDIADSLDNSLELADSTDSLLEETVQELDLDNDSFETLDVEENPILQSENVEILADEQFVHEDDAQKLDDAEFSELLDSELDEVKDFQVVKNQMEDVSFDNFSTNVTPSINTYEEIESVNNNEAPNVDSILEIEEFEENEPVSEVDDENVLDNTPEQKSVVFEDDKEEQINDLFNVTTEVDENIEQQDDVEYQEVPKKRSPLLPLIGVVASVAVLGYHSYTKFFVPKILPNENNDTSKTSVQMVNEPVKNAPIETAMPVETVENVKLELNSNEGNAISVPAIEQNIDASISISNLHVEFEVPLAYKTSKTAERYFTKMGKIIQMNLKTELLLLTKQPVTNRIAVELEYNKSNKGFDVKGLSASSGEKTVDDVVLNTVKSALSRNLNMNLSPLGSIQGNPVLIIKL